MKDESENKVWGPSVNKAGPPKQVKIKFRPGRAVSGLGRPGDVVMVSPQEAERLVREGYADKE